MKLKKYFFSLPALLVAALVNFFIFSSIPTTEAARYYRNVSPCRAVGTCGRDYRNEIQRRRHSALDHMAEIFSVPIALNSLFEQQQRQIGNMYSRSAGPNYDITEDNEKMELTFDLTGVRAEDLSLDLQRGGEALQIKGVRKYRQEGQVVRTEFDQIFTIDPNVLDIERITANLSDGVLVVSAPKLDREVKLKQRKIPILAKMEVDEGLITDGIQTETESETEKKLPVDVHVEDTRKESDELEITEEEDI